MNEEKLIPTINSIYDAALSDNHWDTALQNVLSFVGRHKGSIQYMDPETSLYVSLAFTGVNEVIFEDPLELITFDTDLFLRAALDNPGERIVVGSRLIDERTFKKSSFYNEIYPAYDVEHMDAMSGMSHAMAGQVGVAAVYSDDHSNYFTNDEVDRYTLLWPHLEKAFQIRASMFELTAQKGLSTALAENLDYGLIGLTKDNKVSYSNGKGNAHLTSGDPVTQTHGKLRARRQSDDQLLQDALWHASLNDRKGLANSATSMKIVSQDESKSWTLLVTPVQHDHLQPSAVISDASITTLVKISNHSTNAASRVKTLRTPYKLTPAEADLVLALMSGWSMPAFAENTGRSLETLRSHLKSVFRKTNTSSQQELTRFIMSTPV